AGSRPRTLRRFPYTTLFRSGQDVATALDQLDLLLAARLVRQVLATEHQHARAFLAHDRRLPRHRRLDRVARTPHVVVGDVAQRGDRKSTRMNSSHVKI